ncbi:MAG TPA: o-succinylbenzoate synthase [Metalysinibacillus jejuensis]|uniref:o-succinylbenzoate synthase n=1 Tax=Metalysinibacillus jejuensis TaxID=914327 RepID=A0A921T4M3_9BACL|nr:o-succinylbenzoate synthase [Metalysinibacillus jejuensis]
MKLQQVKIYHLKMPMNFTFTTSFGSMDEKELLVIEATDEDGTVGYGECVAFVAPWYTEETVKTSLHMLEDFLIPMLLGKVLHHPDEVSELFSSIRMNNMAKASIEGAIWDIYCQQTKQSLAQALGGEKTCIDVGIAIGLQPTKEALLQAVKHAIDQGYGRIKVKIKPGADIEVIKTIRQAYKDVPLMADANAAYTLDDIEHLQQLDAYQLLMIEQPLAYDDIVEHATLQRALKTPICLDESIHSLADVKRAVMLGSCQIINVKIGRVGGLTEARKIHDYCYEKNIPIWCGGMLEAGIGRAHNVALTSLPQFTLPGDNSGSAHYWAQDIITPEVEMKDGKITVPTTPGIGYHINKEALAKYTISTKTYK